MYQRNCVQEVHLRRAMHDYSMTEMGGHNVKTASGDNPLYYNINSNKIRRSMMRQLDQSAHGLLALLQKQEE